MRRVLLIVVTATIVFGLGVLAWVAADLPPPGLVLHHGLPPAGGPTGRIVEVEGIRFVELGPGLFRMGSWARGDRGDALGRICWIFGLGWGRRPVQAGDEMPVHWVEIRQPFFMAATEVTNAQYERFDPTHERILWSPGDGHPVVAVSWEEARAFCDWLSSRGPLRVRLPTEAEWEYACRAGSETEYCFGDDVRALPDYAWCSENSPRGLRDVGTRRPNAWGLFDLHGNAWEWCEDVYHPHHGEAPTDGSARTGGGGYTWGEGGEVRPGDRVVRGDEDWSPDGRRFRSASRTARDPTLGYGSTGIRAAASAP